jgi:PAS domain S-box-containing protein
MENIISRYKKIAKVNLIIVSLLSILILLAWHTGSVFIRNLLPKNQLSNPVTAICFIILSASLYFSLGNKVLTGKICSFIVFLISLIKVGEILFNYSSLVDKWLYPNLLQEFGNSGMPNYMAPNTSIEFLILSTCLLLYTKKRSSRNNFSQFLALCCLLISSLSISGYLYNSIELYNSKSSIPMAFPSAMSFLLISSAVLFCQSESGLFSVFTRKYDGSIMARKLIPFAIIIPVLTGALRLYGQQIGLFSLSVGVSLYALVNVLVFVFVIWKSSISLNKSQKKLFQEIEANKSAQIELKSNQLFLDTVLDYIPDLAFIKDADNLTFVKVNKAFEEIIGFSRDQIIGNTLHDLLLEKELDSLEVSDREAINSSSTVFTELYIPTVQGMRLFNIKKLLISHPINKSKYILGIGHDITDQKRMIEEISGFNRELEEKVEKRTKELYRNEKLFRSMLENSQDIISIIDNNNRVTYVSPAIEKILGISPDELISGVKVTSIHPDQAEEANAIKNEILENPRTPKFFRFRLKHAKGHYLWMEGTMTNLLQDESVKGIVTNIHDVTKRIEAENNNRILEQAMMQEQINIQKQLIQATVEGQEIEKKQIGMELHDNINQVLASSKMYLEIGKNDPGLAAAVIQKSAEQINLAIQEIRKLSKSLVPHGIEEGGIEEGIRDITNAMSVTYGIKFSIHICKNAIKELEGKKQTAVYRIVQEQLNNILKHSKAKNVQISLELHKQKFKLEISDDGIGFSTNEKRNGIGLSNIKTRSELLNGELSIHSEPGKGCILKVEFVNISSMAA